MSVLHWVYEHPWVIFIGVSAYLSAFIWLIRDTNKEIKRQDESFRTNLGRKIPPRSPSRKKRGL